MSLTERQRLGILIALLIATLAAGVVSSSEDDSGGIVLAVARKSMSPAGQDTGDTQSPQQSARLDLAKLNRDPREDILVDIFAAKSWYVPPPPPAPAPRAVAVAVAPATPVAPPLPFKYAGHLGAFHSKDVVYLLKAERVLVVSVGEVVEETYRLDAMNESQLTFTYLPLDVQQVLPIPPRAR